MKPPRIRQLRVTSFYCSGANSLEGKTIRELTIIERQTALLRSRLSSLFFKFESLSRRDGARASFEASKLRWGETACRQKETRRRLCHRACRTTTRRCQPNTTNNDRPHHHFVAETTAVTTHHQSLNYAQPCASVPYSFFENFTPWHVITTTIIQTKRRRRRYRLWLHC